VLPDGKIETTAQGTGKTLRIEAFRGGYQR